MEIQSINSADSGFINYDNLEPNQKYNIQTYLQNLGIPLNIIKSGVPAIKKYAAGHKINLTSIAAKIDVMIKEKQSDTPVQNPQKDFENSLFLSGIPRDIIDKGPQAIEQYAKEKNIQLLPLPDGAAFNKSF